MSAPLAPIQAGELNSSAPSLGATSVDVSPVPAAPQPPPTPVTPIPKITPVKREKPGAEPKSAQTSRDLAAFKAPPKDEGGIVEAQPSEREETLAPKTSSYVEELRESIISQRADGKPEDWHPMPQKRAPRQSNPEFAADLDDLQKNDSGSKSSGDRHLTLEEMAVMEDIAQLQPTVQQQSIRRLKSKTAGGGHFDVYIPVYIVCLGLSWVTEQSAAAGTCRDAGVRLESCLQLIAPKTIADNFLAGTNAYDDREIKAHPFNPSKRPNVMQQMLSRILAFCSGLSSVFGKIPPAFAAAQSNPLAEIMILLSYLSIFTVALLICLMCKRSTSWTIADVLLLPIGLVVGSTIITAVVIAILSSSASFAAGYLPNTIVVYTMAALIFAALDTGRRAFLKRKQTIVRD